MSAGDPWANVREYVYDALSPDELVADALWPGLSDFLLDLIPEVRPMYAARMVSALTEPAKLALLRYMADYEPSDHEAVTVMVAALKEASA